MQTSPVQGFFSCRVVFVSACTKIGGILLPSASGATGDGRIVFGSAVGLSGPLQQSNELNIYPDYVLHTNLIGRLYL